MIFIIKIIISFFIFLCCLIIGTFWNLSSMLATICEFISKKSNKYIQDLINIYDQLWNL